MSDSEIKQFFESQTVFITGGTGFLGKVLIEKLLRCDVRKIYVLVRPKKGQTIQERFNTFFDYPCFGPLKEEKPSFENLVEFFYGDCEIVNLGLSSESEKVLIDEVNVVIHAAANVKFDQPLREAANINVRSTRDVLELAKKMPLLKAFVYISTAFSNCPNRHIEEKFYDSPMSAKELMVLLDEKDDQILSKITPKIITPWPNTYTFTKSIAEDLIKTNGKNLPITIIRPAIVMSTAEYPMPSWIDNFYGPIGIAVGAGLGVIRSGNVKLDNISPLVPCDYTANIVLASAWNTAKEKQDNLRIYNYAVSKKNFVTWGKLEHYFSICCWDYPSEKAIWYYTFRMRENLVWHKICIFFQHTVVAYIADFVLICLRRQPIAVKSYNRLNKMLSVVSYFSMNQWNFDSDNVNQLWSKMGDFDKNLFNFDLERIDWKLFIRNAIIGGRIFLLKDPLETVPRAKSKFKILGVIHYTLMSVFYFFLFSLFWWIFRLFFNSKSM